MPHEQQIYSPELPPQKPSEAEVRALATVDGIDTGLVVLSDNKRHPVVAEKLNEFDPDIVYDEAAKVCAWVTIGDHGCANIAKELYAYAATIGANDGVGRLAMNPDSLHTPDLQYIQPSGLGDREQMSEVSTQFFLEHELKTRDIFDDQGFKRDKYEINGKSVVFRNRDELPEFEGYSLKIPDREIVLPTGLLKDGTTLDDYNNYLARAQSGGSELVIVTNTPEGLLSAAIESGHDADGSLREMRDQIVSGTYSDKAIELIDTILATTQYSDTERSTDRFNYEGFAVVLAMLEGSSAARDIVMHKLALLESTESIKRVNHEQREDGEVADPHRLALVHSTPHDLMRDADGNVILSAAGSLRADKFPRATLHFTINGQVSSHALGEWGAENKLIVANLARAIEANGTPTTLVAQDTYFTLNPGEKLTLPDAIVVEGSESAHDVISEGENSVMYMDRAAYTEDQIGQIKSLAQQASIRFDECSNMRDVLREVALRRAEEAVGVKQFVDIGEWGSSDRGFDESLLRLARNIGSRVGAYKQLPEGMLQDLVVGSFGDNGGQSGEYVGFRHKGAGIEYLDHPGLDSGADIRAQRMVVAAGYMPTRESMYQMTDSDYDSIF